MFNIIKDFIPESNKNRPKYSMLPKFITIHETGNRKNGANAKNHSAYLKSKSAEGLPVSWHFSVDDREIYQHLPLNESGWHAGDGGNGKGNRQSVGIEICINADGDFEQAKKNAQSLVAFLLTELNLSIDSVVQHNHWTGKNCPETIRKTPNGWQDFLSGIVIKDESEEKEVRYKKLSDIPEDFGFRETIKRLMDAEVIKGDGSDPHGNDDVIDLSHDQLRTIIFLYRGGSFDRKLIEKGFEPVVKV